MPNRARDLTGNSFGRLTVLRRYDRPSYPQSWYCRCDCGTEIVTAGRYLLDGHVRSCGGSVSFRAKGNPGSGPGRLWVGSGTD
jgi:hypothetical protein